jgi:catechol 2,3-dioxygenase-like lactoylglutathione lyase family enzyme
MRRTPHPYLRGELVVVIDCSDLDRSADFWTAVLGYVRSGPAAEPYQSLVPTDGGGCEVLLQRVSEEKRGKNRLHLDLRTRHLASEVERVRQIGAVVLTDQPVEEAGWRWHILADPDGNEFCILQPATAYWRRRRSSS